MEKEFYLSLSKEEAEFLVKSLNFVKELDHLSEEKPDIDELVNKIYEKAKGFIDEDLIDQKEIFRYTYFNQIYNKLISLFDKAEEPLTVSIDENIKYANTPFIKMLGYESESVVIRLGLFNLISKQYLPKIKKLYEKRLKGEIVPNVYDIELKRADGNTILIECIQYCMPFKDGNLIITIYLSLTKIKSLEKRLRESEERLSNLIEAIPVGISISNPEGEIIECNTAAYKIPGFNSKDDLLNSTVTDHYYDLKDRERFVELLEAGVVKDFEVKLKRKDRTTYWCSLTSNTLEHGEQTYYIHSFQDITERKIKETKIIEQKEFLSEIIESLQNPFYVINTNDYTIKLANSAAMNGKLSIRSKCYALIHKRDKPCAGDHICPLEEVKKTKNLIIVEHQHYDKDGNARYFEVHGYPIFDNNGKVIQMIEYSLDITERKERADKLRLYGEIMANITEGVFLIRIDDGIIIYANPTFEEMFGYNLGEMIGKDIAIVNAPTDKTPEETKEEIIEILIETGEWHGEVKNIKKDGTPFWCYANVSIFNHPEYGKVFVAVHTDITERKKAEQKLKESEENYHKAFINANFYKNLVIHDINNILSNIISNIQLFSMYQKSPEKSKDPEILIVRIAEQCYRGINLASNIQKLSDLDEKEIPIISVEISEVLNEVIKFTNISYQTKDIAIRVDSIEKKLFVQANELLLDIFQNIINNAVKYNENSPIEISVRISKFQKEKIRFAKIEFVDNGIGIPDSRKEQIFQGAYKEEKSVGGMGFGLMLVKKIIETYKGEIWIENRVKDDFTMGSNFIILIPEAF